jgi:hypothetical protein
MPKVNSKIQKGGNFKCQYELKPEHNHPLSNLLAMSANLKVPEGIPLSNVPGTPEIEAVVDKFITAIRSELPSGITLQAIDDKTSAPKSYLPEQYKTVGELLFDPLTGAVRPIPTDLVAFRAELVDAVSRAATAAHRAQAAATPAAGTGTPAAGTGTPAEGTGTPAVPPGTAGSALGGAVMVGGKRKPAKKASKKVSKKSSKKSSKKASVKMVGGAKKKASKKSSAKKASKKSSAKKASKKSSAKKASKKSSLKMVGGAKKKAGSKKAGSKKRAVKK